MRIAKRALVSRIAALSLVLAVTLTPCRAVAEPSTPEIEAKRSQAAAASGDLKAMNGLTSPCVSPAPTRVLSRM